MYPDDSHNGEVGPVVNYAVFVSNPKRVVFFRAGEPVRAPEGTKEEEWAVWRLPSDDSRFQAIFEDGKDRTKRLAPWKAN